LDQFSIELEKSGNMSTSVTEGKAQEAKLKRGKGARLLEEKSNDGPDAEEKLPRHPLHKDHTSGYVCASSEVLTEEPEDFSQCSEATVPESINENTSSKGLAYQRKTRQKNAETQPLERAQALSKETRNAYSGKVSDNVTPPPSKRMKSTISWNALGQQDDLPADAPTPKMVSVANTGCSAPSAKSFSHLAKTPRPMEGEATIHANELIERAGGTSSHSVTSAMTIGCPPTPPTTPLLSRSTRSSASSLASLDGTFSWPLGAAEAATPLGTDPDDADHTGLHHRSDIFRKGTASAGEVNAEDQSVSAEETQRAGHAHRSSSHDLGADDDFSTWEVGDRYEMIRILGRGSYGEVAQARDKSMKYEFVAIKRIKNAFEQEVDAIRIYREMHILRHLRGHTCIIELVDVIRPKTYEELRDLYLVFECE